MQAEQSFCIFTLPRTQSENRSLVCRLLNFCYGLFALFLGAFGRLFSVIVISSTSKKL